MTFEQLSRSIREISTSAGTHTIDPRDTQRLLTSLRRNPAGMPFKIEDLGFGKIGACHGTFRNGRRFARRLRPNLRTQEIGMFREELLLPFSESQALPLAG